MPATAGTVIVPPSVAPVGFVISVIVTGSTNVGTVLPFASCTIAVTGGEIACPAVPALGCVPMTTWNAAPAPTAIPVVVSGVRPAAITRSSSDAFTCRAKANSNVATPATALTPSVPSIVPAPLAISSVTTPVNEVATLPPGSRACTMIDGVNTVPAVAVVGCCVITSCVAPAAVTLNAPLCTGATPAALATSV